MKVSEIIKVIEKIAPIALAESWDKSGMQVAAFRKQAAHVAVMLDPLPKYMAQALDMGADFILSHHPLSLQARFPDAADDYHEALSLLFKADVPLYSAHTSLDCNPAGPVRWLAEAFALKNVRLLEVSGQTPLPGREQAGAVDYGLGFSGELPSPLPYDEFCKQLAAHAQKSDWRSSGPKPAWVSCMACCPGSGSDLAGIAKSAGADVFVSGDVKYHAALGFEINVIDIGHFQMEEIMMRNLARQLEPLLDEVKVSFIPGVDPFTFERN